MATPTYHRKSWASKQSGPLAARHNGGEASTPRRCGRGRAVVLGRTLQPSYFTRRWSRSLPSMSQAPTQFEGRRVRASFQDEDPEIDTAGDRRLTGATKLRTSPADRGQPRKRARALCCAPPGRFHRPVLPGAHGYLRRGRLFHIGRPAVKYTQILKPTKARAKIAILQVGRDVRLELIRPDAQPSTWREGLDAGAGFHHNHRPLRFGTRAWVAQSHRCPR